MPRKVAKKKVQPWQASLDFETPGHFSKKDVGTIVQVKNNRIMVARVVSWRKKANLADFEGKITYVNPEFQGGVRIENVENPERECTLDENGAEFENPGLECTLAHKNATDAGDQPGHFSKKDVVFHLMNSVCLRLGALICVQDAQNLENDMYNV